MGLILGRVALLVRDYDEAIAYFTERMGFSLVEDTALGDQTGGRVFLFLETDEFWRDYRDLKARGVDFAEEPRREAYGMVAVFVDLYGNKWDLVERGDGGAPGFSRPPREGAP
jgi:catechol 2,3-dioxygenase-like lactoylglutathione lyase family enzyme